MSESLSSSLDPRAAVLAGRLQRAAVILTVALIASVGVLMLSDDFSLARTALALVATLPLWIALPRLFAGHRRTYAWMTLVLVPYLVIALMEAIAVPQERASAGVCLFVAFALFVLLIGYLRVARPNVGA